MNTTELLERYNQAAPRYTSYPPIPHWKSADGDLLLAALQHSSSSLSLYVHIPFCERLCLYCGCNVVVSSNHSVSRPYIDRVISEMDLMQIAHGRTLAQIHWGGGTPTYLDCDQMSYLFDAIASRFAIAPGAEISIEIDPRVTTRQQLATIRRLGFNRLSLGIQDFNPSVQQAVRRIQPFEQTRELFTAARDLEFESISVDLIYGLPLQTESSFGRTLGSILELSPDRVSVFSYAHVPSLKRQQRAFERHLPTEPQKLALFEEAVEALTGAGYEYIGIDHFAKRDDPLVAAQRNGTLHRNFQGYTTHADTDLIGLGVSAIGRIGDTFTQNHRELTAYEESLAAGHLPVAKGYKVSCDDRIRGAVIEAWLCNGRIPKRALEDRFGIRFEEYFRAELEGLKRFEEDGLLQGRTSGTIVVTPAGRMFMRTAAKIFDAYPFSSVASKVV